MIGIKELRTSVRRHEQVALSIPLKPKIVIELLDLLEAAEKSDAESLAMYRKARDERDALRARIEAMEKQEPVAQVGVHKTGGNAGIAWSARPLNEFDSLPLLRDGDRLYLAPGAQPAPSIPAVDALAQFIREIDGAHRLGAGVLAERIVAWIAATLEYKP